MASSAPNRVLVARAALILTNSEVASSRLDLNETVDSTVGIQIDFTIGSLTNGIFAYFASADGTTYYPVETHGGGVVSHTLTATGTKLVTVQAPGMKWFRVGVTGTGTVTSSSATVTLRHLRRGTQR